MFIKDLDLSDKKPQISILLETNDTYRVRNIKGIKKRGSRRF